MAENSAIEWTHHTFNAWQGCQKVGPGCDNCYAEARDVRFTGGRLWGPHAARKRTSRSNWNLPLKWNRAAAAVGERHRVFCASLADVFDNHRSIDASWRHDLARLIEATPNLSWMLLTKRIGNAERYLREMFPDGVPKNLWLGATVVNQAEADRDVWPLLEVKSVLRISIAFLSIEPQLDAIDLTAVGGLKGDSFDALRAGLDLVIVGGESGPAARPMHPDWPRSLRDQCVSAGVAFLFKQWGEWAYLSQKAIELDLPVEEADALLKTHTHKGDPSGVDVIYRLGKKLAGRKLDGRTWDEMPEIRQ